MKRLFLISIAMTVAGLISCSGNSQQAKNVVKKQVLTQQNTKKMNVQELTAETFKQKVMNYDIHPNEWIFEGSRPAIIDFYATCIRSTLTSNRSSLRSSGCSRYPLFCSSRKRERRSV